MIEEARIAGLDTGAIAGMLSKASSELTDSIRPELWARVEQLRRRASLPAASRAPGYALNEPRGYAGGGLRPA